MVGPRNVLPEIEAENNWLEMVWGTDDPDSAIRHLAQPAEIDSVFAIGEMEYLTPELIDAVSATSTLFFVVVSNGATDHWVDNVPGAVRIAAFGDARPEIQPASVSTKSQVAKMKPSLRADGSTIAVWGPVGSPGVTTLAISLARVAADDGLRVMLVDADTRGASIAIALGLLDEVPGFAASCRLAGRNELTQEEIERLLMTSTIGKSSFDVLTGLPRASRWAEIVPRKSTPVIELLRQHWDVVIIDCGFGIEENEWVDAAPQRDGSTRSLIAHADATIAVGRADAVGISRLIRGLDELSDICPNPVVVLNHTNRQTALEASDAIARFTEHRVSVTVPADNRRGIEDAAKRSPHALSELWALVRDPSKNPVAGSRVTLEHAHPRRHRRRA